MTPGTCIHYTGLTEPKCKAGVCYAEAFHGDNKPGLTLRMPCIQFRTLPAHGRGTLIRAGDATIRKEIDRRGLVPYPCSLYREPTPAEIARKQADDARWMEKAKVGLRVAAEWRVKPKPSEDRNEVVECPVCKGRLHLSQSSYNGHCHGKCETEGCVSWME